MPHLERDVVDHVRANGDLRGVEKRPAAVLQRMDGHARAPKVQPPNLWLLRELHLVVPRDLDVVCALSRHEHVRLELHHARRRGRVCVDLVVGGTHAAPGHVAREIREGVLFLRRAEPLKSALARDLGPLAPLRRGEHAPLVRCLAKAAPSIEARAARAELPRPLQYDRASRLVHAARERAVARAVSREFEVH